MAEHDVKVKETVEKTAEQLITDNLDIWTTAIEQKSASGRGSSKKFSLHGIKKLRELILELAVRGKLVPQASREARNSANYEPASVLLERIAAEKAQLVKDKKIKKPKALPEISEDEKPFVLAVGWEWSRLGILSFKLTDGSHNPARDNGEGYPMLSGQNVNYGRIDFDNPSRYVDELNFVKEDSRTQIEPKDVLLTIVGSIGRSAVVPNNPPKFVLQRSVAVIKTNLKPEFLCNQFISPLCLEYYDEHGKGTAQKGIYLGKLSLMPIAVPPLEEQHRIVAKVDELMSLCDALEAQTEASIAAHQTLVETLLNALLLPNTTQPSDAQTASGSKTVNRPNSGASAEHAQSTEPHLKGNLEPSLANSPEPSFINDFAKDWQRVAEHFDTLFTTSASIDTLKQTILQLAVMGKLVEQDANDEPATKLLQRIAAEKAQLIADKKIKKQKPLPAITDEEKPFELPNGWEFVRLGDLTSRLGSGSTPRGGQSAYVDEGVIFLRSQNVWSDGLKLDDTAYISKETHEKMSNTHVFPNDVLLNITGASLGRCTIFPEEHITANVSQHVTVIRLIEPKMSLFLHLGIISPLVQRLVWGRQVGMAIEGLSKKVLEQFEFPLPPLEEQHRIVAKVDELMALCDQLKARLSDAQTTQLHLTDAIVEQAV